MGKGRVLQDTSLAAIVRDERMNPAGGIKRFVESTAPYVEEAVIVDTGSIDGTREILEELQATYKNLRVYDEKFTSFAAARNTALAYVNTEWSLVLDADELIQQKDWRTLQEERDRHHDVNLWLFAFEHIGPNGSARNRPCNGYRLFHTGNTSFQGALWEGTATTQGIIGESRVVIKHFVPGQKGHIRKHDWYENLSLALANNTQRERQRRKLLDTPSPAAANGFATWKAYNPQRDKYT